MDGLNALKEIGIYIHWKSYNDTNRNQQRDSGESIVHFIYKLNENLLKVYRNGTLEYQGSPEGYQGWLR